MAENVPRQSPPYYLAFPLWFLSQILKRKPYELMFSFFPPKRSLKSSSPVSIFVSLSLQKPPLVKWKIQLPFFFFSYISCSVLSFIFFIWKTIFEVPIFLPLSENNLRISYLSSLPLPISLSFFSLSKK